MLISFGTELELLSPPSWKGCQNGTPMQGRFIKRGSDGIHPHLEIEAATQKSHLLSRDLNHVLTIKIL